MTIVAPIGFDHSQFDVPHNPEQSRFDEPPCVDIIFSQSRS